MNSPSARRARAQASPVLPGAAPSLENHPARAKFCSRFRGQALKGSRGAEEYRFIRLKDAVDFVVQFQRKRPPQHKH